MPGGTYAVIPIKSFASAKRRLAPILNSRERTWLARLMLEDVLDAVSAARRLSGFVAVTGDIDAAAAAEARGGHVIREPRELGLGHAVESGLAWLDGRAGGAVVVPTDIPHVPPATIDAVIAETPDDGVVLVPAASDGGTNMLSLRPCRILPPLFGPHSFHRHHQAATARGAATRIHVCARAGHDLDRPRDLADFLAFGSKTRTQDYLSGLGIGERMARLAGAQIPANLAEASA